MQKKFKPIQVENRAGENIDRMVKKFIKKVRSEGIIDELRARSGYDKPSVKRRKKRSKARFEQLRSSQEND